MITALIIDDSPEDREQFTALLKSAEPDVFVVTCKGGRDGVPKAQEHAFECVLLDLRLDGESGLDVLAELQEAQPNLPVIVLTGQGSAQTATDAFVAGSAYYLPKDGLTAQALWTAVSRVIRQAETEHELKANREAMERSNRLNAVGQLAAGIAHDFNNQLGALRYCIEFLKDAAVTDAQQDRVRTALKIIDDSANLASRMLSLSRQGDLLAKNVSLESAFQDLKAFGSASVSERVSLEVGSVDAELSVYCDPAQFLNALLNLMLNANDAVAAKGGAGTISFAVQRDGGTVRVTVKDDGIGMSEDVLTKCTDPFFTTKSGTNGTGLGLAMVQGFANENRGKLLIQSDEGKGTEVTLVLPLGQEAGGPDEPKASVASVPERPVLVLVVEDRDLLAQMTKDMLDSKGFSAEVAQDAETALERLTSGLEPDAALIDIGLPGMNGFDLASAVHRHDPDIGIIYLTGYANNPEHPKQELHGPIMQKPIEPGDLVKTINTVLAGRHAR